MKIVFVIAGLGAGGAERVISLISNEWIRRGWKVSLIAFDGPDDPVYHEFHPSIELIRLNLSTTSGKRLAGLATNIRRLCALRRHLREMKPDLVISFLTKINAVTLAAGIGLGVPAIVSERNNPQKQASHPLWRFLLDRLYLRAAAIVMQTSASLECLPRNVRPHAVVIPNPISAPAIGGGGRASHPPTVSGVGRLIPQKGFDLLISAFALVAEDFPEWRLVIWGEGDGRPQLESLIAHHHLDDRIKLAGLSDRPGSWIDETDIFALSSRFEGFPNVLGEAMAAGLPVIAFDCPFGPADLITHDENGMLIQTDDIGSFASGLARLMDEKMLRDSFSQAARRSMARLRPETTVDQWTNLVHSSIVIK